MTASPWLFPLSDGISVSLSSLAYGLSDCGKNRHYAKKPLLIKTACFAKSSWNIKNNSSRSSYTGVLSWTLATPARAAVPHRALWWTSQFLVRKAPFCSKTSREPFTYFKMTFKVKFVPQQAPSPFTHQRPHHNRMVLPRWGRGRNDWVTSPGLGERALWNKHWHVLRHKQRGKVMILIPEHFLSMQIDAFFHQINTLTSPPNHLLHSQGDCQSCPWHKGQRKETFAASSLAILCHVFCQNRRLKLFHTQPAKGVKLHLYWHWFQYQPANTSRCQLWDHFQILKTNIQGSEYFYHLQDWSDKLLALFTNASVCPLRSKQCIS